MAKGALAKEQIINKILETFEGSFINDKEVRIPWKENGEILQIKISLTCAKTNVEIGVADVIPGINASSTSGVQVAQVAEEDRPPFAETAMNQPEPPSSEEKSRVAELCKLLNL